VGSRWLAAGVWTRPDNFPSTGDATFGASFDPLGNFVDDQNDVHFCAHVRLTPLVAVGAALPGNGMMRAEVRVFWPRAGRTVPAGYCSAATDANAITINDTDRFHFVHVVSAVRQGLAP
jgi:hypothetical protein